MSMTTSIPFWRAIRCFAGRVTADSGNRNRDIFGELSNDSKTGSWEEEMIESDGCIEVGERTINSQGLMETSQKVVKVL